MWVISTWQEIEQRPELATSGFRGAGIVDAMETIRDWRLVFYFYSHHVLFNTVKILFIMINAQSLVYSNDKNGIKMFVYGKTETKDCPGMTLSVLTFYPV